MLESLITSKTRIKILLKFFGNQHAKAYLRSLADEFGESTNSVRLELNNLANAGFLHSNENGRTIEYRANTTHPLFPELNSLVHKYLGLDKIVENILKKLGKVYMAFVTGDYAQGKDSGLIDLVIVGEINTDKLKSLVTKAETLIKRKIRTLVLSQGEFEKLRVTLEPEKALWLWKE